MFTHFISETSWFSCWDILFWLTLYISKFSWQNIRSNIAKKFFRIMPGFLGHFYADQYWFFSPVLRKFPCSLPWSFSAITYIIRFLSLKDRDIAGAWTPMKCHPFENILSPLLADKINDEINSSSIFARYREQRMSPIRLKAFYLMCHLPITMWPVDFLTTYCGRLYEFQQNITRSMWGLAYLENNIRTMILRTNNKCVPCIASSCLRPGKRRNWHDLRTFYVVYYQAYFILRQPGINFSIGFCFIFTRQCVFHFSCFENLYSPQMVELRNNKNNNNLIDELDFFM